MSKHVLSPPTRIPFPASVLRACLFLAAAVPGAFSCGDGDDTEQNDARIWRPDRGATWQWQLSGTVDTGVEVEMFDIDLFDTPQNVLDALHDDGRIAICYFSAGSFEDWRPDADAFPAEALGMALPDWEGEFWLDVTSQEVREIMRSRLDMAVDKGCDGVEPDNVDGFDNKSGFDLTYGDQLDFNRFIADAAHERGLSVGLKNDVNQIGDLAERFDWALNEECFVFDECALYAPFMAAGKAVFHTEYVDDKADGQDLADAVCGDPSIDGFSTLIKTWDLDAWYIACD